MTSSRVPRASHRSLKAEDPFYPFHPETFQGPQVSKTQFDGSGLDTPGISIHVSHTFEFYSVSWDTSNPAGPKSRSAVNAKAPKATSSDPPSSNTSPDMKIVREEIFGPVGVVIKFKDEEDVIRQANGTLYGPTAALFTQNVNRAIKTAHRLKTGTVWVNCMNQLNTHVSTMVSSRAVSGGSWASMRCTSASFSTPLVCVGTLRHRNSYTAVVAVHINLDIKL